MVSEAQRAMASRVLSNTMGRRLQRNARGRTARAFQIFLADQGHYAGKLDGIFLDKSVEATKAFQTANGLAPTGKVDEATFKAARKKLPAPAALAMPAEMVPEPMMPQQQPPAMPMDALKAALLGGAMPGMRSAGPAPAPQGNPLLRALLGR
jgi:hypothetical protein